MTGTTARNLCLQAFAAALLGLWSMPLQAATWYVSTTGSDLNDCSSPATACATVAKAVSVASDGDDIDIAAGSYVESAIHVDKALDVHGAGAGSTDLEPSVGSKIGLYVDHDDVTLRDLTLRDGSQGVRFEMAGATIRNTDILNVNFEDMSSRGIEVHNDTTVADLTVDGCSFERVNVGLRSASSAVQDGVSILNSTFRDNALGWYQANDGSTGYAQDVRIADCEFSGHTDTPVFAEELRRFVLEDSLFENNVRGFTMFKAYTTAGVDFDDITIRNNTFRNPSNTDIILFIYSSGATNVAVQDNVLETDVGLVTANWGQIDLRFSDQFANGPVEVSGNTVTLSGSFSAGATAVHAVKGRGDLNGVSISGNALDGGSVGDGGGVPPTSGIYLQTQDPDFGSTPPDGGLDVSCNTITGFVQGLSVYDPGAEEYGNLPSGAEVRVFQNNIAGNSAYGAINGAGGDDESVVAEQNWWGSPDGPSGDGPGSGDAVAGNVDFDPFLAAAVSPGSCPFLQVDLDVRPGNDHNQINTNARQLVPIAILGTAGFDPCAESDPDCVDVRGAGVVRDECADVNGDGSPDQVLYFRARDMDDPSEEECADPGAMLTLNGCTTEGQPLLGSDRVTWVGPSCK